MKLSYLAPFLLAASLHAQAKPAAPVAPAVPVNVACSSDPDASGFTECERLRMRMYQLELQPYYDKINPIVDAYNQFIQKVMVQHPGMNYRQPQQGDQAFPYGRIVPAPKPTVVTPPPAPVHPAK